MLTHLMLFIVEVLDCLVVDQRVHNPPPCLSLQQLHVVALLYVAVFNTTAHVSKAIKITKAINLQPPPCLCNFGKTLNYCAVFIVMTKLHQRQSGHVVSMQMGRLSAAWPSQRMRKAWSATLHTLFVQLNCFTRCFEPKHKVPELEQFTTEI
jgi:hypothetical protein